MALSEAQAGSLGADSNGTFPATDVAGGGVVGALAGLLLPGGLARLPLAQLLDGGPHCWGFVALLGWLLWLATQAPWRQLLLAGPGPRIALHPDQQRGPGIGGGIGAALGLPTVLRTWAYGTASALLWLAYLDRHSEFKSWEDVYFFCGEQYQHCTAGFRWDGSGWLQGFVLWNFVLSSALLLQKFVIALGLGGLLPGEEVVTRESFVSIAWRLVPYYMNQWEQQWGAECSSMLFELPHFALELLVVLPCVQILCGRLRVMSQPHIREPLAPAPPLNLLPAEGLAQQQQQQQRGAAPAADGAPGDGVAQQAPLQAAAGAAAGAGGEEGACWVPDVMRCRWRRDPEQRRLLPRLTANLRAMAMLCLMLAVAASNSLVVPLALERLPAGSPRADQILRFRRELAFLVSTGRHADTALWYQRVAAAAAAAATQEEAGGTDGAGGEAGWAGNASGAPEGGQPAAPGETAGNGGGRGGEAGAEGGPGFLAAALEGSSNSSRLDAKLAVWSTLWRPLLPAHWLRAVLAADASQVAGLDPAYLSALQYEEHPQSAALAQQLHAAANDPSAVALASKALQLLLRHPDQAGRILPTAGNEAAAGFGADDRNGAMVHLLLMASMAAGIDARTAPLQLKAAQVLAGSDAPAASSSSSAGGKEASLAAAQSDLRWLRQQQALYATKLAPAGGSAAASAKAAGQASPAAATGGEGEGGGSAPGGSSSSSNGSSAPTWQQQQRMAPLYRLLHKHCVELDRMRSADHRRLIPLVEASLAIMRLSCERFFSLLAVFLGFLAFRDPPPAAQRLICWIAGFATVFQRLVLYSFPAICWAYGAGALFSSFVSVVFWTGPLVRAVERVRNAATSVQPRQWRAASHAEVERMGGQCAICWGDMPAVPGAAGTTAGAAAGTAAGAAAGGAAAEGAEAHPRPGQQQAAAGGVASGPASMAGSAAMSLPCGHAYHRDCLQQWLQQCYGQARGATCPMCQASIPLRVRFRMPWHHQTAQHPPGGDALGGQPGGAAAAAEGIPGLAALAVLLQDDFRARFEPMLDPAHPAAEAEAAIRVAAAAAVPAAGAQNWPPADAVLPAPPPPPAQQQVAAPPAPAAGPGGQPPAVHGREHAGAGGEQQHAAAAGVHQAGPREAPADNLPRAAEAALAAHPLPPAPDQWAGGPAAAAAAREQQHHPQEHHAEHDQQLHAARRRGLLARLLRRPHRG